jgi:competence protein ComEA
MSRRNPGAESATGVRPARDRLSATLGGAGDAGHHDDRVPGLLELPVPPRTFLPADPFESGGSGRSDDSESPAGGLRRPGRDGMRPLSTRFRGRTGLRPAVVIAVLAAVLGGWFWWHVATGAPEVVPLSEVSSSVVDKPTADAGDVTASGGDPAAGTGNIIVHVAGAVARPGVVELPHGSRLHEAIAAAGGGTAAADPDRLNLASVLEDGQKVLVPERGDPGPAEPALGETNGSTGSGAGGSGSATDGGKIDLNTAGVEELATLPRVGPVLAQRIVDWRKQHGRFKTVEELDAVDGVGPKLLEALLPLVRV